MNIDSVHAVSDSFLKLHFARIFNAVLLFSIFFAHYTTVIVGLIIFFFFREL